MSGGFSPVTIYILYIICTYNIYVYLYVIYTIHFPDARNSLNMIPLDTPCLNMSEHDTPCRLMSLLSEMKRNVVLIEQNILTTEKHIATHAFLLKKLNIVTNMI